MVGRPSNFLIARFFIDGTLDTLFGTNGVAELNILGFEAITCINVRTDGKMIASGYGDMGTELAKSHITLLNLTPDGTLSVHFSF